MKIKVFSRIVSLLALFIFSQSGQAQDLRTLLDSSSYFWDNQNFEKAFETLNQGVELAKNLYETKDENGAFSYAFMLNQMGVRLYQAEVYDKAESYYSAALPLFREAEGEAGSNYITTMENLALCLDDEQKFDEALDVYAHLLSNEAFHIAAESSIYQTYNAAAICAYNAGNRDVAFNYYENALSYLDESHADFWVIVENLLVLEQAWGSGLNVQDYLTKFIERFPDKEEEYRNLIAYLNRELALQKLEEMDYKGAIPHLETVIKYLVPEDSVDHVIVLYSTHDLTSAYVQTFQFSKALPIALKNEKAIKDFYGQHSDDYLYALNYLSLALMELADYDGAKRTFDKAFRLLDKSDRETKGEIKALFESNYVDMLVKLGKYEEARNINESIVLFYSQNGEKYFDDLLFALNQAALVMISVGEYEQAEAVLKQALAAQQKKYGLENEMGSRIASNLTAVYIQTGLTSRALQFIDFVLANDLAVHGEQSFEYSFSLQVAGSLYVSIGAFDQAIETLKKSYELRKSMVSEDNRELLRLKQTLGTAYFKVGKLDEAQSILEEVLAIQKASLGAKNFDVSLTQNDLGMVAFSRKNYSSAEAYFKEALNIRNKVLGPYNQFTCTTLFNLACTSLLSVNQTKTNEYFGHAMGNYLHVLDEFFPFLSEKERLEYYHTIKGQLGAYYSMLSDQLESNPSLTSELFNTQIRTKSMLLNESVELRNYLENQQDPEVRKLYEKWTSINQEIAKLQQQQNEGKDKVYLDSLKVVGEEFEKALNSLNITDRKVTTWQEVAQSLKDGEVAVEIIRVTKFDFENNQRLNNQRDYLALIVDNKTTDYPKYVKLTNGAEMDAKLFTIYKNNIKFKLQDKQSHDNFWAPIASQLGDYEKVYFSSDGVYHLLNLNTLLNPETSKYVLDEWNIEIVGNTSELLDRKIAKQKPKRATLFGFPNFNSQPDPEATNSDRTSVFREIFTEGVSDLPGTKVEVQNINQLMAAKGLNTQSYLANEAHEKQLKSIASTDILHIATHGFFEESSEDLVNDDPLLHSGLLLANLKESISADEENGIITAKEIAQLNLHNNQLVVLSACETGRGKVVDGQGVYGLQRAFQVAGAQNVIISLWKVDDEATKELMTLFYESYLQNSDPRASLKTAQIQLKEKFPEPIYWGAFYVVGN